MCRNGDAVLKQVRQESQLVQRLHDGWLDAFPAELPLEVRMPLEHPYGDAVRHEQVGQEHPRRPCSDDHDFRLFAWSHLPARLAAIAENDGRHRHDARHRMHARRHGTAQQRLARQRQRIVRNEAEQQNDRRNRTNLPTGSLATESPPRSPARQRPQSHPAPEWR